MLGIHMSLGSNLADIPNSAKEMGNDTFQIFLRNNRNMKRRTYYKNDIDSFNMSLLRSGIISFVVHAPYSMNPCTDSDDKRSRVINTIKEDLMLMNKMAGIKYYVLHPGSYMDCDLRVALGNLVKVLNVVKPVIGDVRIALEFMAGAGTQVLCTVPQINYIMAMCYDIPNICICFDTCHVFASGNEVIETFKTLKQYIGVVHLNNSATVFGSRKDRHATIVNGCIPSDDLCTLYKLSKDLKNNCPVILETPNESILNDLFFIKENI